jgi:hypothetical protein
MERACSRVAAVKRLLREVMATVDWDILNPIWVSLKKNESLPKSSSSLRVPLYPLASTSTSLGLGHY